MTIQIIQVGRIGGLKLCQAIRLGRQPTQTVQDQQDDFAGFVGLHELFDELKFHCKASD